MPAGHPCQKFFFFFLLVVFTVTPSKIKMETFRYRKSRNWEMKENKITISLAKNQVCALFYIRDIGKNDPNLSSFVWKRHVCVPFRGANSWVARDVTKTQTKKLSILLSFYFHEVLQYLNTFT